MSESPLTVLIKPGEVIEIRKTMKEVLDANPEAEDVDKDSGQTA